MMMMMMMIIVKITCDDADTVDGAEKRLPTDTDSSVHLQAATWRPAKQRISHSLLKQTQMYYDQPFAEFPSDDAGQSCNRSVNKSSNTAKTQQISADKCDSSIHRLNSVCSKSVKDERSSSTVTHQMLSDVCVSVGSFTKADETQSNSENIAGVRQRGRPRRYSKFKSVSSTQSANAALKLPRRTSSGLKRKSTIGNLFVYVLKIC